MYNLFQMENLEYMVGRTIDPTELSDLAKITLLETYEHFPHEHLNEYHKRTMSAGAIDGWFDEKDVFVSALRFRGRLIGFSKLVFGGKFHSVRSMKPVELQKLYVLKRYHGSGFGKLLVQKTQNEAARRRADTIWLAVQAENRKAIQFYEKISFVASGERMFTVKVNSSLYSDKEIIYSLRLAK
jgi:GNAT superfamily N-acetyltransferase